MTTSSAHVSLFRQLTGPAKLLLALLASVLGGIGGYMSCLVPAILLAGASDLAKLISIAACGLSGGGVLSIFLAKYHLRAGWRETAGQMWPWFALVTAAVLGVGALVGGMLRLRELGVPGNAPSITALLLLALPALGAAGALLFSGVLLAARRIARVPKRLA